MIKYIDYLKTQLDLLVCDIDNKNISYNEFIIYIRNAFLKLRNARHAIYFIGNGGSAGIAIHMTADYLKNGKIKTHNMFDPATITCLSNDFSYEYVFSKQLEIVAEVNDMLIAISSSGNSANIIKAVELAKLKNMKVFTLSGFNDKNKLRSLGNYNIYVPSFEYGIVESIHNIVLQHIVDEIFAVDKE